MQNSPLDGIRVLDFTQAMAGPFATMLLGDLGCDVVKVEPPTGDQTRRWAPPYMHGMSSYFLSVNRNKRSIVIDLNREEGKQAVRSMIGNCDVIIENFRPGTMEKFGLDYETIRTMNPSMVYCSLSGFGKNGPYRNFPGYDLTILSHSGLMSVTGEEDGPPVKFGVPIGDIVAGLFANISILSALLERSRSGDGQHIDLSMFDANLSTLTYQAFDYFATGENPSRLGSAHSSIAPYQTFETSDGHVSICVGTEKLWKSFVECMDLSEAVSGDRFLTNMDRVRHRKELADIINAHSRTLDSASILEKLRSAGIPCAPINSVSDALGSEQAVFREMVKKVTGKYGEISSLGSPFRLSRTPGTVRIAPPMLGQHSEQILEEFGLDKMAILRLKETGTTNSEVKPDESI